MAAYEKLLLDHGVDYRTVDHTRITEDEMSEFFRPDGCERIRFENRQRLDFEGLRGRLESSSYAPAAGTPGYPEMIEALHSTFDAHQRHGAVSIDYDTVVYLGRLG